MPSGSARTSSIATMPRASSLKRPPIAPGWRTTQSTLTMPRGADWPPPPMTLMILGWALKKRSRPMMLAGIFWN